MLLRLERLGIAANNLGRAVQASTLERRYVVQKIIVSIVVFSIVVISINIYLIRKAVVNPLQALSAAVDHIGSDDFVRVIPTKSHDEVGKLAYAFDPMVRRIEERTNALKKAQEELQIKVEESTSALRTVRKQNELLKAVQDYQGKFISNAADPSEMF